MEFLNNFTPDDIIAELNKELQICPRNPDKIKDLCATLIEMNVYPAFAESGCDALTMVNCYGADWHIWREPLNCRHCHADLCDHDVGPPFKLEIGVMIGDLCESFVCPFCGKTISMLSHEYRNIS